MPGMRRSRRCAHRGASAAAARIARGRHQPVAAPGDPQARHRSVGSSSRRSSVVQQVPGPPAARAAPARRARRPARAGCAVPPAHGRSRAPPARGSARACRGSRCAGRRRSRGTLAPTRRAASPSPRTKRGVDAQHRQPAHACRDDRARRAARTARPATSPARPRRARVASDGRQRAGIERQRRRASRLWPCPGRSTEVQRCSGRAGARTSGANTPAVHRPAVQQHQRRAVPRDVDVHARATAQRARSAMRASASARSRARASASTSAVDLGRACAAPTA